MRITQDVRDYAEKHRLDDLEIAIAEGMKEKAQEFVQEGARIYQEV
jgi:phosphomethylpyrimidine synthase